MAVIPGSLVLHWTGSTSTLTWNTGPTYTAVWRLQVDDPLDQAKTVRTWFEANVVAPGDYYEYGNDTQSTFAWAQNISANRMLESCDWWLVTVQYGTEQQQDNRGSQLTEGEVPTNNPIDWRPRLAYSVIPYEGPVVNATYKGGYDVIDFDTKYPVNTSGLRPMASNGMPFENPPPMRDFNRVVFALGKNFATVDANAVQAYDNVVNNDNFQFQHRGITYQAKSGEMKLREVRIEPRRYASVDYLEVDFVMEQAPAVYIKGTGWVRTWNEYLIDVSGTARACLGDPDGTPTGTVDADCSSRTDPSVRVPKACDDLPIHDVFLLDGKGQPLDICAEPAPDPVAARWEVYEVKNFLDLDGLQDLIIAWDGTSPYP